MSLYEADLHSEFYADPFARLEVNERQAVGTMHLPVILNIPAAVVLDLNDDEADVTLNLTAQEARNLAMHLLEAARAAEGGAA